jgi:hypothetical protein
VRYTTVWTNSLDWRFSFIIKTHIHTLGIDLSIYLYRVDLAYLYNYLLPFEKQSAVESLTKETLPTPDTLYFIIVRREKEKKSINQSQKANEKTPSLRVSSEYETKKKKRQPKNHRSIEPKSLNQAAAIASIFFPFTLFHSKNTAPTTLNTDVATAT